MEDFNNITPPQDDNPVSESHETDQATDTYSTTYVEAQRLVNAQNTDMNVPSLDLPSISNPMTEQDNANIETADTATGTVLPNQTAASEPPAPAQAPTPAPQPTIWTNVSADARQAHAQQAEQAQQAEVRNTQGRSATDPSTPRNTRPVPEDPDVSDYVKPSKPTFPISQLPDLRETLDPDTPMNPEEAKSREEFTTVYDIIDSLEESLENAKTSLFTPGMVRVDRDEFTDQLNELKKMLPVQLERASALMREAERRLESAQTQANAIVASAQSRAADTLQEANKQAQIIVGQNNITDLARQRARTILDNAQARADHLTHGADEYCTTVMTGLQEQLSKLSHDVQAGLNVLEERQRAAGETMPRLDDDDYPDAQ